MSCQSIMMSDHFQLCQDILLGQFFHSAKNPALCSYFSHCHCFHKVYMCMNVHTCTHTMLCTQPVHHIFVTHTAHTYSTLALLRKWNLVHNTYIHSCTVHLYARILMKNIKHVYTHTCTLHVRSILNLFSAPAHALYSAYACI